MKVKSGTDAQLTEEEKKLEKELFAALKTKDKNKIKSVYSKFYRCYSIYLRKLCVSKVNNHEDINDLLMDTFVSFFNSLINDKIKQCFKSYLMTIFNFKCIEYNEKNKEEKKMIKTVKDISEVAEYYDSHIDTFNILQYLNKTLTPLEKEIVLRHIVRGESLLRIREELKLFKKDIHKVYNKSIEKLRKEMEDDYND